MVRNLDIATLMGAPKRVGFGLNQYKRRPAAASTIQKAFRRHKATLMDMAYLSHLKSAKKYNRVPMRYY